ncbi:SDR family oxidoreductase [Haloferacaceae archaeon DSL9]
MDLGIDGDVALVTASSSGLGYASAAALAREGATVSICGRDPDRVANAGSSLAAVGDGDVLATRADLTDPDDIETLVEATVDAFGGIDHVVTSAGGVPPGPFVELTERDWYGAYDALVMSAVWTIKEVRPYLEASDAGTITCIASTAVREVVDDMLLSNAVRRPVVGLVKSLAREFAPGIRVNAVLPGGHETARVAELIDAGIERGEYADYDEGLADRIDTVPLGRLGDPAELGDAVAFLASDRASFVTGACLPVDGGTLRS